MTKQKLIEDLNWRGMIQQMTAEDELKDHLNEGMKVIYCGFCLFRGKVDHRSGWWAASEPA